MLPLAASNCMMQCTCALANGFLQQDAATNLTTNQARWVLKGAPKPRKAHFCFPLQVGYASWNSYLSGGGGFTPFAALTMFFLDKKPHSFTQVETEKLQKKTHTSLKPLSLPAIQCHGNCQRLGWPQTFVPLKTPRHGFHGDGPTLREVSHGDVDSNWASNPPNAGI